MTSPLPRPQSGDLEAQRYMRAALREARRGLGRTSPNPAVGAVLAKDGLVVARGYHARAGAAHAEAMVLARAGGRARGADLYTTLEPCDHFGRTPPCSKAIIEAGVKRVFVGSRDPNPLVNGRGLRRLRRAGVEVFTGILEDECNALNEAWFLFMREKRPFVTLKVAVTLDGRIATRTGDARWVTGEEARRYVHRLRDTVDAILVGRGTAMADDPSLTTRLPRKRGKDPIRVVLDTELTLPEHLAVLNPRSKANTILVHACGRRRTFGPNVELMKVKRGPGGVCLSSVLRRLAERGVVHVLVEGGASVHGRFLEAGLVDRMAVFVAPKLAGADGVPLAALAGPGRMADALTLGKVEVRRLGDDVLITGTLRRRAALAKTPRRS